MVYAIDSNNTIVCSSVFISGIIENIIAPTFTPKILKSCSIILFFMFVVTEYFLDAARTEIASYDYS